jgi:cytochrome c peroxidase
MKHPLFALCALLIFTASCSSSEPPAAEPTAPVPDVPKIIEEPTALGPMKVPGDNPSTPEKIDLGKMLFFDTRLSKDGKMSCETCHLPEKGWTDSKALSTKFDGSVNARHTPTLYNVGFYNEWYWDGRAATLEAQITAAWRGQMGADVDQVATTLNGIEGYKTAFAAAMGGPATPQNIAMALAAFVRTIRSEDAPWDKYEKNRDRSAISSVALAGFEIFRNTEKANCSLCHLPPHYTDGLYHNTGVGFDKPNPDMGRGKILAEKDPNDQTAAPQMGAFKTPTLRSVTESGPYFHDGRAKTLEEAVDFMLAGGIENPNRDEKLRPRKITAPERMALIEFIKSLTPAKQPFERPRLP